MSRFTKAVSNFGPTRPKHYHLIQRRNFSNIRPRFASRTNPTIGVAFNAPQIGAARRTNVLCSGIKFLAQRFNIFSEKSRILRCFDQGSNTAVYAVRPSERGQLPTNLRFQFKVSEILPWRHHQQTWLGQSLGSHNFWKQSGHSARCQVHLVIRLCGMLP